MHTLVHAIDTVLSLASFLVWLPVPFIPSSHLPDVCIPQDAFFYSLVYDPQQKTLLADKGEIRVGNKFQADITDLLKEGRSHAELGRFN